MKIQNLSNSDAKKVASAIGDTVAGLAFGLLVKQQPIDKASDLALQHAYEVLEAAVVVIVSAVFEPGKITQSQWKKSTKFLCEILACPADFDVDTVRTKIYHDLGYDLQ